jgi:hypothetical protein
VLPLDAISTVAVKVTELPAVVELVEVESTVVVAVVLELLELLELLVVLEPQPAAKIAIEMRNPSAIARGPEWFFIMNALVANFRSALDEWCKQINVITLPAITYARFGRFLLALECLVLQQRFPIQEFSSGKLIASRP